MVIKKENEISEKEFITNTPLYRAIEFSEKGIIELEFFEGSIDAFCPLCKQESVFQRLYKKPKAYIQSRVLGATWRDDYSIQDLLTGTVIRLEINVRYRLFGEDESIMLADYLKSHRVIPMNFICSRDNCYPLYYIFSISGKTATKIGQFPSLADLHTGGEKKYRKILGAKHKEFIRAIRLSANGIGIGSFVYLRRVFEELIERAHIEAKKANDWDEEKYTKSRMDDKIQLLKKYLPSFLVENRKIYKILSKGIHALSEEECLKYYSLIKAGIELMLDEIIEKQDKEEKIAMVQPGIDEIHKELKGKNSNQ